MATQTAQRRTGRIVFRTPRPARFGTNDVFMIDLSLHGAGIRHQTRIAPGTEASLRFKLEKQEHAVRCRLLRSKLELTQTDKGPIQSYRSGMAFVALDTEVKSLRDALNKRVHRALLLQKANALAKPELADEVTPGSDVDVKFLAPWLKPSPFVRCTFEPKKGWRKARTSTAEQPENGFTVLAEEGDAEIDKLCKTWEISDAQGRELIRLFAHLSLTETSDIDRDIFAS